MKLHRSAWIVLLRLSVVLGVCFFGVAAFAQSSLPSGLFRLPAPASPSVGPLVPSWTPTEQVLDTLERLGSGEGLTTAELRPILPQRQLMTMADWSSVDEGVVRFPDHSDVRGTATEVRLGTSGISGFLTHGDADYFHVAVPSSGTLSVWTTGDVDTIGVLEDSEGKTILSNDDESESNWNFRLVTGLDSGHYYVRVTPYDANAVGFYQLNLRWDP